MSLVNLKDMLSDARKNKYAVGAFDVCNYDMADAVVSVAEELKSPVILMGLRPDLQGGKLPSLAFAMRKAAEKASVPVCVHLDHSTEFELVKACIENGFTSVMLDGSVLPLQENIEKTKAVVDYAHRFGVTVEAELGHVGNGIVGSSESDLKAEKTDNPDDYLTKPDEMQKFIEATNVDTLAVAIGTAHGVYVKKPVLRLNVLEELNRISTVPLVMHGGSGTPDEDIRKSIALGICKINIFSEMLTAYYTAMKTFLNSHENLAIWPSTANEQPMRELRDIVRKKLLLFGSQGKA